MNNSLRFVKGHCGWDTVTLVVGEEVPEGKEIETALKILDHPISGGIEDGLYSMLRHASRRPGQGAVFPTVLQCRPIDSRHRLGVPMRDRDNCRWYRHGRTGRTALRGRSGNDPGGMGQPAIDTRSLWDKNFGTQFGIAEQSSHRRQLQPLCDQILCEGMLTLPDYGAEAEKVSGTFLKK